MQDGTEEVTEDIEGDRMMVEGKMVEEQWKMRTVGIIKKMTDTNTDSSPMVKQIMLED